MREIKFRAWVAGKHGKVTFSVPKMGYGVSIGGNGGYLDIESGRAIDGEILTIPVMQYIGLKDRNGKEIYEGDIYSNLLRVRYIWWPGEKIAG